MLHFNLEKPVRLVFFGEFISPERDWKHLTRNLLEYELFLVTEGVLYIADDRREYEVHAGEYLIMPPTPYQHGTRVCQCRFYWLHFHCPTLPVSLSLPKLGRVSNMQSACEIAKRLLVREANDHRGLPSHYLATELLLELGTGRTDEDEPASAQEELCMRIKEYVVWHRFSDVRICDIAREVGYHEKYLSAVFSKCTKSTLKSYIEEQRVKEAKRLLLETDYTVAEVSDFLNFKSAHNFSRFFKTHTDSTPSQWRDEHKKTP